ncbi:hypothetical protein [Nocardioides ferulae]|uniref:hypothetical protein n=1 Tax=Nocardioides ferulae TaxID=2340821 RepID=UPI000EB3D7A3|nr:hypothetical protein [Nocardioides ferulae]
MRLLLGAFLLALVALTGCGADETAPSPDPAAARPLDQAWEHDLVLPPNSYTDPLAVAKRHWLASGSFDNSPGTTNPTPNVPLPYTIGDSRTGDVTPLPSLGLGPVQAIPGTRFFVAVADGKVAVIDPAKPAFVWTKPASIGTEVVDMSATRIWMGRTTDDGHPICFTVATGRVVEQDAQCLAADIDPPNVIDGVSWWPNPRIVEVPGGGRLEVPVVDAHDVETRQPLWSFGDVDVRVEDDTAALAYSAFAGSALGLARIDYAADRATLRLVDVRTGDVTQTLGRVDAGTLVGFSGKVAVFEERHPDRAPRITGYVVRR